MNYGKLELCSVSNGVGMRVSLFVSGCTNHCKGCFQPETWDFHYGKPYTKKTEDTIIKELENGYYQGLTILGGEPFEPCSQQEVSWLIKKVKTLYPDKDIWMYTGFVFDKDLIPGGRKYCDWTDFILDNIDILVDGPFVEEKKNINLKFRGSENQRIIDMKKTRKSGSVVLSDLN